MKRRGRLLTATHTKKCSKYILRAMLVRDGAIRIEVGVDAVNGIRQKGIFYFILYIISRCS